jgi:type I restriction enzyme S subunit
MSRYKAYPEYKDSGEDWLGEVPSHWNVIKIKHLSPIKRGASPRPIDDAKYFDDDGEYAWTRIADVTASDVYLIEAPQRLSDLGSSLSVKLEPESLFLSIAGTVGKPCITGIKACIHDGFVYFPELRIPNKFLFYVFAGEQAYKGLGKFGTQLNLNTDTVGGIKIGCTDSAGLEKIVAFLEHETAKIDALIEKQQRLIELLKEKRQAVISHAVTKGLNPNAPLKDSGVEWLGEVPSHWEVKRMKYSVQVFEQGWSPQCDSRPAEGEEFGVLKVGCVNGGIFNPDENKALPSELLPQTQYILRKGDFLISRANTRDLVGSAAVVEDDFDKLIICDKLYRLRFSLNINPHLLSFYLTISSVRQQIELGASGASDSMQNISQSIIKELQVLIPPAKEAELLVDQIKNRLTKFDQIHRAALQQVVFLHERRTALISAAVTGKIDVRDWQPAAAQEEVSVEC